MRTVFAGAFYYLALINPKDSAHAAALRVSEEAGMTVVTTVWVLAEVADALSSAKDRGIFSALWEELRSDEHTRIVGLRNHSSIKVWLYTTGARTRTGR